MKPEGISASAAPLRRSLASVKILVALGQEHGVSPEACLRGSGITTADLADPASTTNMEQELTVIRNLQEQAGQEAGLGLAAGLRYSLTSFGILGYAMLSSASMREGLTIMFRYLDLMYGYLTLRLEEDDREFSIVIDDERAPPDVRQFLVERMVGALAMTARALVGAWKMRGQEGGRGRAEFRFERPAYARAFEQIGPEDIIFSAARNRVVGDRSMLDIPLPQQDEISQHLALAQCDRQLEESRKGTRLTGFIVQHISQNIQHVPDIDSIATLLAMTARTLRRRLVEEGTTYRELVDQVRSGKAKDLLQSGHSVGSVAAEMGFSEVSSFIRAFRRWTGTTPGDYENR